MELMKKHKFQILLPVALVLIALIAGLLYNGLQGGTSSKRHTDLGKQYLNNLNYAGAVLEFTNAITLDPTNTDARVGLAKAYSASGDTDMAVTVLKDVMKEDNLDPELTQALIDIYKEGGNHSGAIQLLGQMIQQTDNDEYYDQIRELMSGLYSAPRPYSKGYRHQIMISGDKVATMGSNACGQLGSTASLGDPDYESTAFANAGFPGEPKKVLAASNTSFVIDKDSNLWAAGENSFSQLGLSFGAIIPEGGWQQLTTTGDVADAAYARGCLMVLKYDGTLWMAGAGASQKLQRCTTFNTVVKIAAHGNAFTVLDSAGNLYRGEHYNSTLNWNRIGKEVMDFAASRYVLAWINANGNLCLYDGVYSPDGWTQHDDGSYKIPFSVQTIAAHTIHGLFLLTDEGKLMYTQGQQVIEVPVSGKIVSLYTTSSTTTEVTVAVLENGDILVCEEETNFFPLGVTQ